MFTSKDVNCKRAHALQLIILTIVITFSLIISPVSTYAQVIINEVELYPSVSDEKQWVELFNTSNSTINLGGWTITALSKNMTITIPEGTMMKGFGYLVVKNNTGWMDHKDEVIVLRDQSGNITDKVGPFTEINQDSATWQRYPNGADSWRFVIKTPDRTNGGFPPLHTVTSQLGEPFTITKFSTVDGSGKNATRVHVNDLMKISAEVANNNFAKQSFTYIVKINDSDGITVDLFWFSGKAEEKTNLILAPSWIPKMPGTYDIEIFIWESLTNPSSLAYTVPHATVVVEK